MKQKTVYCCEFCSAMYLNQEACEEDEALHFGLTRRQYLNWRKLNKDAAKAGKMYSIQHNAITSSEFDEAIKSLVDFESSHGLQNYNKKPQDFYF